MSDATPKAADDTATDQAPSNEATESTDTTTSHAPDEATDAPAGEPGDGDPSSDVAAEQVELKVADKDTGADDAAADAADADDAGDQDKDAEAAKPAKKATRRRSSRSKSKAKSTPTNADGLTFERFFTKGNRSPFDMFEWKTVTAELIDYTTGQPIFRLDGVEVPVTWSQNATNVLAQKYFRKKGVPQYDEAGDPLLDDDGKPVLGSERSARQWAHRLANAWRTWGEKGNYFASEQDAQVFYDELVFMLLAQMASPNSPQHFNTGLHEAYEIEQPSTGNWYRDPDSGKMKQSAHRYERSAVNACFINGVGDQLVSSTPGERSIFQLVHDEARLFQSGSGTGSNFSAIRAEGEALSGGGTASGVLSFLNVLDAGAGATKSGGTTRRAAKMVILDVDHPEILDFIDAKVRQEDVVRALAAAGFPLEWNHPKSAYTWAKYQNANNSVRLNKEFMDAYEVDGQFSTVFRTTGKPAETLRAREVMRRMAQAAWDCADPGVQFDHVVNDWHTGANDGRINGSNPCAEYMYLDDTACNLASLRLTRFYDAESGTFDMDAYQHAVRTWTVVLEISVAMSHYPTRRIAELSYEHRTLGLGFADIGALLMQAGLPYDSTEGRAAAATLASAMTMRSYATSTEMARAVGACEAYGRNRAPVAKVLRNHARAALRRSDRAGDVVWGPSGLEYEGLSVEPREIDHAALRDTPFGGFEAALVRDATDMLDGLTKYGVRNMQVSVIAPTGTIAIQMDCDTTGPEPDFAAVKFKTLAGGGTMKIVNQSIPVGLRRLGYTPDQVDQMIEFLVGTQTLDGDTPVNREALLEAGLTITLVDRAERNVPNSLDLGAALAPASLGAEDVADALGVALDTVLDADFNLLRHLGFTAREAKLSSKIICGHQTLEGAPHLADEHLAVFDCSMRCGNGTRMIAWQGHVTMLGALAPFLSGAISKTINMPGDATVDDVEQAYVMAHELGIKALSIYRDGSKESQVLTSSAADEADEDEPAETPAPAVAVADGRAFGRLDDLRPGMSPTQFYGDEAPPRFRLPSMAFGPRWKFKVGETSMLLRVSEFEDGTPGEIFIDLSKEGSTLKGAVSCFAIAVSKALQWGMPLSELVEQFKFHTFEPNGMVTGHDNLKTATSIIDAVFRTLAYHYLGDAGLVHVPYGDGQEPMPAGMRTLLERVESGETVSDDQAAATLVVTTSSSSGSDAGDDWNLGYETSDDAPLCTTDGSRMRRNGSCYLCPQCGSTSGCS